MLISLCLQAIPAQSAEIVFDNSTADRMLIDLAQAQKEAADKTKKLNLCLKDRTLQEEKTGLLEGKITGLQKDKETYRLESDRFQAMYVAADTARIEAKNNAPSRLRWFGAGAVTALVAVIAAVISVK